MSAAARPTTVRAETPATSAEAKTANVLGAIAEVASNTESTRENDAATANARVKAEGISPEQVAEIKNAIQAQQKFLGEIVGHGDRWELDGAELRIYFPPEKRPFAEMMEGREALEKIRTSSSKVLGRAVRVCARVEVAASSARGISGTQELRAQFERDPLVRSMLQRFGGRISEVKWRQEES